MSMFRQFVKCEDGKWYEDLIYRDKDDMWFICFDDSDPIELVARMTCKESPRLIVDKLGLRIEAFGRVSRGGSRVFGKNKMCEAKSVFITMDNSKVFPTPRSSDTWTKVYDKCPRVEGDYYGGD